MRNLSDDERRAALLLGLEFESDDDRRKLLADLDRCSVEETTPDGSIVKFHIEGYQRPSGHGRGPYRAKRGSDVAGVVMDADGAKMDVLLLADANHRVWELEIVRYEAGSVIKPDWRTFQLVT